ncbi:hypothetical protein VPH35_004582 [Triticum aestivum]
MNFAIPSSFRRYDLYIDLNQSILFLRRAQDKVDRRLSGLHPVVAALQEQAARLEESNDARGESSSAPDAQHRQVLVDIYLRTRALCWQLHVQRFDPLHRQSSGAAPSFPGRTPGPSIRVVHWSYQHLFAP